MPSGQKPAMTSGQYDLAAVRPGRIRTHSLFVPKQTEGLRVRGVLPGNAGLGGVGCLCEYG
jgi:hypothetical protein